MKSHIGGIKSRLLLFSKINSPEFNFKLIGGSYSSQLAAGQFICFDFLNHQIESFSNSDFVNKGLKIKFSRSSIFLPLLSRSITQQTCFMIAPRLRNSRAASMIAPPEVTTSSMITSSLPSISPPCVRTGWNGRFSATGRWRSGCRPSPARPADRIQLAAICAYAWRSPSITADRTRTDIYHKYSVAVCLECRVNTPLMLET